MVEQEAIGQSVYQHYDSGTATQVDCPLSTLTTKQLPLNMHQVITKLLLNERAPWNAKSCALSPLRLIFLCKLVVVADWSKLGLIVIIVIIVNHCES